MAARTWRRAIADGESGCAGPRVTLHRAWQIGLVLLGVAIIFMASARYIYAG